MISVVIPLFNKQDSIRSTIESVLAQSFKDFELIVVDDGSTDGSVAAVKSMDDPRIRLIEKRNGGVSSARNEGIRRASGEYVAFLDGDDLWGPGFLAEVIRLVQDCPEAGIFGTSYYFLENGSKHRAEKPLADSFYGIVDNSNWDKAHIYCSSAVCCRKTALEEVGMFDERIAYGEDLDVWWRIMLKYPAAFSNKPLATYRFDEGNRAMTRTKPLGKMHINYLEKYAEYRRNDDAFRHFIDKECMWWLFPYALENKNDPDVRRILGQIDLNEYKPSFRLRFRFPKLYSLIRNK